MVKNCTVRVSSWGRKSRLSAPCPKTCRRIPPEISAFPQKYSAFPQKFLHSPKSPLRSPRNFYIPQSPLRFPAKVRENTDSKAFAVIAESAINRSLFCIAGAKDKNEVREIDLRFRLGCLCRFRRSGYEKDLRNVTLSNEPVNGVAVFTLSGGGFPPSFEIMVRMTPSAAGTLTNL